VNSCFSQAPNVQAFLPKVYGNAQPQFIFGDVQDGLGSRYQSWRDIIGPIMSDFRQNLLAKENALQLLIQLNHGQDIDLQFAPDIDPWALIDSSEKPFPGIRTLLERVDSTTKCNFEQLGKEAKDVLVSKASRPPSQSSHDLSTP
jgi:hypothetical protein